MYLTPLIDQNKTAEARNSSLVNSENFINVRSYSGFLTVDERYNSNLFFWYFPNANETLKDTPWIIWLQGGPGGSSLIGLFSEMGPFELVNDILQCKYIMLRKLKRLNKNYFNYLSYYSMKMLYSECNFPN